QKYAQPISRTVPWSTSLPANGLRGSCAYDLVRPLPYAKLLHPYPSCPTRSGRTYKFVPITYAEKNMEGTNDSPESLAPFYTTGDLPEGLLWVWSVGGDGPELDLALRMVASGGTGALALRVSPPRSQTLA